MTRLPLVDAAVAAAPVSELLTEVQRRLGATPNMTRAMANSPALLKGYLDLSAALSRGVLGAATGERIALTSRKATPAPTACRHTVTSPSMSRTWTKTRSPPRARQPQPTRRPRRSSPSPPRLTTAEAP
jgi:hypothetical protein